MYFCLFSAIFADKEGRVSNYSHQYNKKLKENPNLDRLY